MRELKNDPGYVDHVLLSDELILHTSVVVNKYNETVWSQEVHHTAIEVPNISEKIPVRWGMNKTKNGLLPFRVQL